MYSYSQNKEEVLNQLRSLAKQLDEIKEEIEIEPYKELKHKITNAISSIESEKFSIVFFGAFSDGKSTILSALTKSLDVKISVEPATDEIKEYKFRDYLIVDTPGLFSDQLMHEEKTKKYISEANVIIYVVDAVNPLKESHHKTLKWLLKDLGKIDSTIFVINKMDEVADLEDEEDFKRNCEIKREVVENVLKEVVGVPNFKRIICMSGDPFGLGLMEWFNKESDYRKLSRIGDLENIINEFIEKAKEELAIKSGLSVIKDIVIRTLKELENLHEKLKDEIVLLNNQIDEYEKKLNILEKDINRSYINIKRDILSLREDILQEIETSSNIQDLANVCHKRFGKDGYVIGEYIDLIIRRHTEHLEGETKKFLKDIEESLEYHSNLAKGFIFESKHISKALLKAPTRQIADAVLKIRDLMKLPIKFKPWGTMKVAKSIKNLTLLIVILETAFEFLEKRKFDKKKEDMKKEIDKFFKDCIETLTPEEYRTEYFPYISEVEKILVDLKSYRDELRETLNKIEKTMIKLKNFT